MGKTYVPKTFMVKTNLTVHYVTSQENNVDIECTLKPQMKRVRINKEMKCLLD